jgi:hypothetical protein
MAGSGGSLLTGAGTWTFSTATAGGGNVILLNGQPAAGGSATELEVANQGNLYADNLQGQWWQWYGSGWSSSTNPTHVGGGSAAQVEVANYGNVMLNDWAASGPLESTAADFSQTENCQFFGFTPARVASAANMQISPTLLPSESPLIASSPRLASS